MQQNDRRPIVGTGLGVSDIQDTGIYPLNIEPQLTTSGFLARIPVPLVSMATTYAEALRAAGLPE